MNKKIPELLIIFVLFVSPLLHSSIEDSFQTRRMWSWCLLISLAIIVFFARYIFRVQKIFLYLGVTTGTILFSSFILALYTANPLAIYLIALVLLVRMAVQNIIKSNTRNSLLFIVLLLGCFSLYAQWGIGQFIVQHDLGMRKLGESVLNQNIPGVASFYIGSDKFIRAYGPFSHANSFAGVLLLGIVLLYKHLGKFQSRLFIHSVLFLLNLGIITSFSRTAMLGLLAISLLLLTKKRFYLILPIFFTAALFTSLFTYRSFDTNSVAAHDRLEGLSWFRGIADTDVLLRGVGLGNYTRTLTNYLQTNNISHNAWDRAPIHSVPLFLIAELGLMICIPLFIIIAKYVYAHNLWIFIVMIPSLILDHYFATQVAPAIFLITSALVVVQ